jgi:hypothetical protein
MIYYLHHSFLHYTLLANQFNTILLHQDMLLMQALLAKEHKKSRITHLLMNLNNQANNLTELSNYSD